MAYQALVTKIQNVHKDPNSERLYLAEVFNEGVIVGPDIWDGQLVLYLPSDGQIDRWFGDEFHLFRKNRNGTLQGGYIDDNGHIRAIKLRGNQSSGIVLKVEQVYEVFGDQKWSDGDKVTTINDKEFCRKYIPSGKGWAKKHSQNSGTSYKGRKAEGIIYPEFAMHKDTEQLAYNLNQFKPGDEINITLKVHGTSQRSMKTFAQLPRGFFRKLFRMKPKTKPVYILGTRRCVVTENSQGYYGNDEFRVQHHKKLEPYVEEGMEVFYEVVGYYGPSETQTIMPSVDNYKLNDKEFIKQFGERTVFSYGCEPGESEMYIYRITSNNGEKEWTPQEITDWCFACGFKRVPIVDNFTFTTVEDLQERINKYFEDLVDPIGKTHLKEGVVARIVNRLGWKAYKSKTYEFKVLSGLAVENVNTENMSQDILEEI